MHTLAEAQVTGERWHITGRVQGVGFRPFVWQQARALGIRGQVWNQGDDVIVEAWAAPAALAQCRARLQTLHPEAARIDRFDVAAGCAGPSADGFAIAPSSPGPVQAPPPDDRALCEQCLAELLDPGNRRYRHAFIHCTACGPRYSLIRTLPFDRAETTMAAFAMCGDCAREFNDPRSRRFHAQTISCPACGPSYRLETDRGAAAQGATQPEPAGDVALRLAAMLEQGRVVAIKSTGGFRLACRASCDDAVARLRELKQRPAKPFALMALDAAQVANFAVLGETEACALRAADNPIVLLAKRAAGGHLAAALAPGQSELGFMLPGTGLEHLLMRAVGGPLVMTSGNVGGEPQWLTNDQARALLGRGVDAVALHDREIQRRIDDSVVSFGFGQAPMRVRRARGCSSRPLTLAGDWSDSPAVLATGGGLKNTFCLLRQGRAVVSPHNGDLHHPKVLAHYRHLLQDYLRLLRFEPACIALDRHPEYGSSRVGRELAGELHCKVVEIGHHHAHIASVMAESGLGRDAQVIGVAFDGLGLGDAGELWGGEFLVAGYRDCKRFARLMPAPLPGGDKASSEPWRNLLGQLWLHGIPPDEPAVRAALARTGITDAKIDTLWQIITQRINSPSCSSVGRLFDALAAVLGCAPQRLSFEGQAAMAVEACARPVFAGVTDGYPWHLETSACLEELNLAPLWRALLTDLGAGIGRAVIAARVHRTLIEASVELLLRHRARHGINQVVLAGGVFHNRLLHAGLSQALEGEAFRVLRPRQLPANDAGLSLGQAAIASTLAAT